MGSLNMKDGLPLGRLGTQLWRDTESEWVDSLHNPFVLAMAQGTLPRLSFQHYVAQDAYYLQYFARAYAMALAKCGGENDDAFDDLSKLLKAVSKELKLHDDYARSSSSSPILAQPAACQLTNCCFQVMGRSDRGRSAE